VADRPEIRVVVPLVSLTIARLKEESVTLGTTVGILHETSACVPDALKTARTLLGGGGGVRDRAFPARSTAMQRVVVGHDTELRTLVPSIVLGADQLLPAHERVVPPLPSAMQKLRFRHDTELRTLVPSMLAGDDQLLPFHDRAFPA